MKIHVVTPAAAGSLQGNRVTAERWAGILGQLGHRVTIKLASEDAAEPRPDLLIALHARKSAASIQAFEGKGPVIVALTGTDLYGDIHTDSTSQRSLQTAWRLIALQPRGIHQLPPSLQSRVRVIVQSVPGPVGRTAPRRPGFAVVVSGHLRPVKDPFRAAEAARQLPASSSIEVLHVGAALEPAMAKRAQAEMATNPRYRWLGEVPRDESLEILWRSRLLVLSSHMEGGANVVCEALAGSVPVLSTRIEGSVGLLGEEYPGYFEVGDTAGLTALLRRCEEDAQFYASLERHCAALKPLVDPAREVEAWRQLLLELEDGV